MLQDGSNVKSLTTEAVQKAESLKVLGGSKRRYAQIGDIVVISVKKAGPRKMIKRKMFIML